MQTLSRGQKLKWSALSSEGLLQVGLAASLPGAACDISCFGLDDGGKLSDERYFIFYNQKSSPCGALNSRGPIDGDAERFAIDLARLPATIRRLVFVITTDGQNAMNELQHGHWRLCDQRGGPLAEFAFRGSDFGAETALIVGELYRTDEWRVSAVGQGFSGGLSALLVHFGGEEISEPKDSPATPSPPSAPAPARLSLEKKLEKAAPHLLSRAKPLKVLLEKRKLEEIVARVGLVLDASGSMNQRYRSGDVQTVIDRIFPLAVHFDDNGEFDTWAFGEKSLGLSPVGGANLKDYIERERGGWKNWKLGARTNDEPGVIRQVIKTYRESSLPAFVIFISDGGVQANKEIERLIVDASKLPIFWQFIGLGGSNYGILERLDAMPGRVVDNCNFFALDDIHSVGEQELYERLLTEFPQWLKDAREKRIVVS